MESFNLTYQLTSCSCLFCMYNKASLYWDISCFLSPYGCCEALDGKMHGLMIYEIGVCFFYLYWCGFWSKPFFFHFIVLVNTFLPLRILMHICVGTLSFPKVFLLLYACKEGNTRLMHYVFRFDRVIFSLIQLFHYNCIFLNLHENIFKFVSMHNIYLLKQIVVLVYLIWKMNVVFLIVLF